MTENLGLSPDLDLILLTLREAKQSLDRDRDRVGYLEMILKIEMEKAGATEFVGKEGTARLVEKGGSYDFNILDTLLEYLDEQDVVALGALLPAHQETIEVKRKWNLTKTKPLAKRGSDIREVIEKARVPGAYVVDVTFPVEFI